MRRALTLLHRWTGIAIGLWIALVALSGIGMVFSTSFYSWELGEAETHVEMRDAPYVSPEIWLAKAEVRYGKLPQIEGFFGPRATPMRISAPTIVYEPAGRHAHGIVTVDPYTGEPLAHFVAEDTWSFVPLWLHLSLFVGEDAAGQVTTALSIMLIVFGLTGLYLWGPGRGRTRAALAVPRPRSPVNLRRFHAAIGAWSSPLIILAGFTGLLLSNFEVAEAVTKPLGAAAEFDPSTATAPPCRVARDDPIGLALQNGKVLYPGRELASVFKSWPDARFNTLWLRPADSTVPARGDTELVVDAKCGNVVFHRGPQQMKAGDTVLTYVVELHNGRLLSLFGEALIILQGVAIAILPLAGITLWLWRRRRIQNSDFSSDTHLVAAE